MAGTISGCGFIPELPEMTEQQEKLVTEYAAGLLLKYDNSYDNGILSEEELAKAEQQEAELRAREERQKELAAEYVAKSEQARKEKEEKEAKDKAEKDSDKKDAVEKAGPVNISAGDMPGFMGLAGISLEYKGMETVKSYPKDGNGVFSVDASNGRELAVVSFNMSNVSSDAVSIDMFNSSTSFKLELAGGNIETNCPTLLLDDLAVYKNELSSGASENVIILFEVNDGSDLTGANLIIKSNGAEATVGL